MVGTLRPGQVRLVNGRVPCEVLQTEPITRPLAAWRAREAAQVVHGQLEARSAPSALPPSTPGEVPVVADRQARRL